MFTVGVTEHLHGFHDTVGSFVRKRNEKEVPALALNKREQDIIIPGFGTENEVALPVTELFSEQLIGVSFTAARRQSE